ncbi:MAG: MAPEG family protein [Polyangiaceae bacterium]
MTLPFVCTFLAFLLCYASKIPLAVAMAKAGKGRYDNHHPRAQQAEVRGWGARAHAAHLNSFEGFAPFAASVLIAHVGHGNPSLAAMAACTYVASRVVYIGLYLADLATLRSLVWFVGIACIGTLFLLPAFA